MGRTLEFPNLALHFEQIVGEQLIERVKLGIELPHSAFVRFIIDRIEVNVKNHSPKLGRICQIRTAPD